MAGVVLEWCSKQWWQWLYSLCEKYWWCWWYDVLWSKNDKKFPGEVSGKPQIVTVLIVNYSDKQKFQKSREEYHIKQKFQVSKEEVMSKRFGQACKDVLFSRNFKKCCSFCSWTFLEIQPRIFWLHGRHLGLHCIFFFVVALTALILSRDAVLVSCAFYFRYKSLPSPVSLVNCIILQVIKWTIQSRREAALIGLYFCTLPKCSCTVIISGLGPLFLLFVLFSSHRVSSYSCETLWEMLLDSFKAYS